MRTLAYIYTLCVLAYPPYAILTDEPKQVTVHKPEPYWICDCGAREQLRWNDPEKLEFTEINGNLR